MSHWWSTVQGAFQALWACPKKHLVNLNRKIPFSCRLTSKFHLILPMVPSVSSFAKVTLKTSSVAPVPTASCRNANDNRAIENDTNKWNFSERDDIRTKHVIIFRLNHLYQPIPPTFAMKVLTVKKTSVLWAGPYHIEAVCASKGTEAIHLFCTNGPHTIAFSGQNCGYLVNGLPKPVRLGVRGLFAHICLGHQRVKWQKPAFKVESGNYMLAIAAKLRLKESTRQMSYPGNLPFQAEDGDCRSRAMLGLQPFWLI